MKGLILLNTAESALLDINRQLATLLIFTATDDSTVYSTSASGTKRTSALLCERLERESELINRKNSTTRLPDF